MALDEAKAIAHLPSAFDYENIGKVFVDEIKESFFWPIDFYMTKTGKPLLQYQLDGDGLRGRLEM